MVAMLVIIGTRYACHSDDKGTKQFAILVLLGTRYACHVSNIRDQVCLPCW